MRYGIGQPVLRKEDVRFLTGTGTYTDDINLPGETHAAVVYSPHAHAEIVSIDAKEALAAPGVIAVLTGADMTADGVGGIAPEFMPEDVGGPKGYRTSRRPLADGRVRHVGERVALVIAETEGQARDAADLVMVDYKELPAVTSAREAAKDGAPQLYDEAKNNVSFTLRFADAEQAEEAFRAAAHVARVSIHNQRLTANAMEPRSVIGVYSAADDLYTLYSGTQNPYGTRTGLSHLLHIPESNIRVVARDVGGGFGMKGGMYPDDVMVVWAAKRVGRPVKFTPTRSESLLFDDQARDQTVEAELALDKDGNFLALRWQAWHNVGAYIVGAACVPVVFSLRLAPSVYNIPVMDVMTRATLTNTVPTVPYRGAGRPEAVYIIERLIDTASREMGIDPIELRRRNFIKPDAMPFHTHGHFVYDSGEFSEAIDKAVDFADWKGFDARRKQSEAAGKLRGRGLGYYIDDNGIFNERMEIRFDPSGSVTIFAGTFSHGQGHETTYAQMLSAWLGVDFEQVRFEQGDTAAGHFGRGTYGSRSMTVGGSALRKAADEVIENGRKLAAHLLEAAEDDIEFDDGKFTVAGTDKSMTIQAVAQRSYQPAGLPIEFGVGLGGVGAFSGDAPSFPNGCHIAEIEIDRDTGEVTLDRYTAIDDIGTVLNPLLAQGQIHGAIVQGAGQALMEGIVYDETGQLVTGSFMDYCMPRADDMPTFDIDFRPVPAKTNPLGVKGVGEGGTTVATPTVINAVVDALASAGVTDAPLPATPNAVWKALQAAK